MNMKMVKNVQRSNSTIQYYTVHSLLKVFHIYNVLRNN